MNQVIVRLEGGMGNQLFQYAAARAVALRNNSELLLDIRETIDAGGIWPYELKYFNICARIAKHSELPPRRSKNIHYKLWRLFGGDIKFIKERGKGPNINIINSGSNCYLEGYFQSEEYFSDISQHLRKELTIIPPPQPT